MEIPTEFKELYKHWNKHTQEPPYAGNNCVNIPKELEYFISERMKIWEKKYRKEEPPYTTDTILQNYRFCNIYRELDRQTIEIHRALKPFTTNFPLWLLNLCFHRFICKSDTVDKVGLLSFDPANNASVYKNLMEVQKPKYGNAYIFPISVIQKSKYPTREKFFCLYLPKVMLLIASKIESFKNLTVNEALKVILPVFGFNMKFHWAEILIDVTYQHPEKINLFQDFYIGPGALLTAKRLRPNKDPVETVNQCVNIKPRDFPYLQYNGKQVRLSAENWEGIFCEYRKYCNLKSGAGRRRKFGS